MSVIEDPTSELARLPGIGRKTASIVLLFCFGLPLMPVDRHVERVSKRIGLIPPKASADDAHEMFLALLEPDEMYEAHVNLIQHGRRICHARNPAPGVRIRFIGRRDRIQDRVPCRLTGRLSGRLAGRLGGHRDSPRR